MSCSSLFSFKMKSLQIVSADPEIMGDLGHREVTQSFFFASGEETFLSKLVEFPRNLRTLHEKFLSVESERMEKRQTLWCPDVK